MALERKIGNTVYRCDKLPAEQGLAMLLRVMAFFRVVPDMMQSVAGGQTDASAISAFMIVALSDEETGEKTHKLMVDLAQTCRVGTDACVVGVKPAELEDLIQVAWLAMECNFAGFFRAGLGDASAR